jgi:hypothetical protein
MFQGVSRLLSGHFLKYDLGRRATREEVSLGGGPSAPRNIEEAVEAFDVVLSRAVGAAAREGVRSIYLSGGLDSRIIAGYLRPVVDGEMTAITLGDRRDIEMRAAARVTTVLGAAHERVPINLNDFPGFAEPALDSDAMSSGLYLLLEYSFSEAPRLPVLTGFLGDSTFGGGSGMNTTPIPVSRGTNPGGLICSIGNGSSSAARPRSWLCGPGRFCLTSTWTSSASFRHRLSPLSPTARRGSSFSSESSTSSRACHWPGSWTADGGDWFRARPISGLPIGSARRTPCPGIGTINATTGRSGFSCAHSILTGPGGGSCGTRRGPVPMKRARGSTRASSSN